MSTEIYCRFTINSILLHFCSSMQHILHDWQHHLNHKMSAGTYGTDCTNITIPPLSYRHCATSRKVAGSIPDGVIWIFNWHNPSGRSDSVFNRNKYQEYFMGIKAAGAQSWQSYRRHVPNVLKSESLYLLEPSWPLMGLFYLLPPIYASKYCY